MEMDCKSPQVRIICGDQMTDKRPNGMMSTFTELNRVIIREKLTSAYRVWLWLRYHDPQGCGWYSKSRFIQKTMELGITKRRAMQLYVEGLGSFWILSGDHGGITYLGIRQVCEKLDTAPGYDVPIPIDAVSGVQLFKATLFKTWFAPESWKTVNQWLRPTGGKAISMAKLEELFGVSRQTLRIWARLSGLKIISQFTYSKFDEYSLEHIRFPENVLEGRKGGYWLEDVDGDGEKELVMQTVNHYSVSDLEPIRNMNKSVRRHGGSVNMGGAKPKRRRIFFDDRKKAREAIADRSRDDDVLVLTKSNYRGFRLFEIVSRR